MKSISGLIAAVALVLSVVARGVLGRTVVRPLERTMVDALVALRRQLVKPLLEREMQEIRVSLKKQIKDTFKLGAYLDQVQHDVLEHVELFTALEDEELPLPFRHRHHLALCELRLPHRSSSKESGSLYFQPVYCLGESTTPPTKTSKLKTTPMALYMRVRMVYPRMMLKKFMT